MVYVCTSLNNINISVQNINLFNISVILIFNLTSRFTFVKIASKFILVKDLYHIYTVPAILKFVHLYSFELPHQIEFS